MNKKILISLSVIGVVAAIAIGGTIAYFSDVETSTGNTFTAGTLDLILNDVQVTGKTPITGPIFTLTDMKPGDKGEKTVELYVDDNPACGFVDIAVADDKDNSCTEPEQAADAENGACVDPNGNGELNDEVNFLVWKDNGGDQLSCDNILNGNEVPLVSGPLTSEYHYSIGGLDITPVCYGIAYCFGEWNMNDATCDGSLVGNESQSDSFTASLTVKAEQYRTQWGIEGTWPAGCPVVGVYAED